ncbi:MAG TPA: aldolase/citrate lyase family protein [Ktedonobacterales bacterium]|nr:aldolase/citrate lyase family protein [Ktedonobacterales bacterium]
MDSHRPVHRSGLTMPINNARFVNAAWTRGCDGFTLDLQDSVPQSQKAHARTLVPRAIEIAGQGGGEVQVRINQAYIEADVAAAVWPGLSGLNMGHTLTVAQVRLMDASVSRVERERGLRPGSIEIDVSPDSVLGTTALEDLVNASSRIGSFGGVGGYDYALSLGVEMFTGVDAFFYPRGLGSLIARAHGKAFPLAAQIRDTSGSVSDADHAFRQAEATRKLGGRRGSGLHPNVVEPMNRALTPPPEEVAEAERILTLWQELDERHEAEGVFGTTTVDRYEAARARELLDWAAACAAMDAHKQRAVSRAQARRAAEEC